MACELKNKKIWIAGHNGMLGSALLRKLEKTDNEILTVDREELDLRDQVATQQWVDKNKPDLVFLAAAKVGGILANQEQPVSFLYDNLMIGANVIHAAAETGVEKLLFLGTSCIYPKDSTLPIKESALLTGALEPTNQWYAIAKIAGTKLCQAYRQQEDLNFISAMPTNLYGPNDNFDLQTSHVLPGLMHKIHLAKKNQEDKVSLWGSGKPKREFMHVDDCADALIYVMKHYEETEPINIGTGEELSILELAERLASVIGWEGEFELDSSKPDGTLRKFLDSSKLKKLGWEDSIKLEEGLKSTYDWFLAKES